MDWKMANERELQHISSFIGDYMTEYEASLRAEREWAKSFSCSQVVERLAQEIGITPREATDLFDSCKDYLLLQRLSVIQGISIKPPSPLLKQGIDMFTSFPGIYNEFSRTRLGVKAKAEIYT